MAYKKKIILPSLSSEGARKERTRMGVKNMKRKKLTKKALEDRKKREKEWREWWS